MARRAVNELGPVVRAAQGIGYGMGQLVLDHFGLDVQFFVPGSFEPSPGIRAR
jgi:hypothetical protein